MVKRSARGLVRLMRSRENVLFTVCALSLAHGITQVIMTDEFKAALAEAFGKKGSQRLSFLENLLPEVAVGYPVKPISTREDANEFLNKNVESLKAVISSIHRGSGVYKAAVRDFSIFAKGQNIIDEETSSVAALTSSVADTLANGLAAKEGVRQAAATLLAATTSAMVQ